MLRALTPIRSSCQPLAIQASNRYLSSKHEFDADGPQMNIGMVCPINGGVEITGNRPRLIKPFLKRHIEPDRLRRNGRGKLSKKTILTTICED